MYSPRSSSTVFVFAAVSIAVGFTPLEVQGSCVGIRTYPIERSGAFAFAVAASSDYIVYGAPMDGSPGVIRSGSAVVFVESPGNFTQQSKLTANDASAQADFGNAVAASGEAILVGSYRDSDLAAMAGSAYVFRRTGVTWAQEAKLVAPDGVAQDQFGSAVGLDGDVAAVAAIGQDAGANGSGAVYVFLRSGGNWTFSAKLVDPAPMVGGRFGHTVGVTGDRVLVGSNINDRVRIFRKNGAIWPLDATLTAIDPPPGATGFGTGMAVSGDTLAVSSIHLNSHQGVFFLFQLVDGNWTFLERKDAPDAFPLGHFGWAVAMSENHIVVGAEHSRRVFLYQRIGDQWRYETMVQSSDPAVDDGFGTVVGVGSWFMTAGAPDDDSKEFGLGVAYVFPHDQCTTPIPALGSIGVIAMTVGLMVAGARLVRKRVHQN